MDLGKIASQAGHGYLGAFLNAQRLTPHFAQAYQEEAPGTKICLQGNILEIERALALAQALGIPSFLTVDSGCKDFYDGEPIVTSLGLGPSLRHIIKPVVKKFRLL